MLVEKKCYIKCFLEFIQTLNACGKILSEDIRKTVCFRYNKLCTIFSNKKDFNYFFKNFLFLIIKNDVHFFMYIIFWLSYRDFFSLCFIFIPHMVGRKSVNREWNNKTILQRPYGFWEIIHLLIKWCSNDTLIGPSQNVKMSYFVVLQNVCGL